jgi:hypothetical protein
VDVEMQILHEIELLSAIGVEVVLAHVPGHRDRKPGNPKDYDRQTQLNIMADELATYQLDHPSDSTYQEFPENKASLLINGEHITSKCTQRLRIAFLSQPLRQHMTRRFKWHSSVPDMVWWSAHGKALKILSHNDRMRLQKFIHDHLPTNHHQHKIAEHIEDKCAECHLNGEDDDHVLRCRAAGREVIRTKWLQELSTFLRGEHTPQAVHDAILGGLEAWLNNNTIPTLESLVPDASKTLERAYRNQTTIGWRHFVRGRMANEWAELIKFQLSAQSIDTKVMSVERWGVQVISINWHSVLTSWEHRNTVEHGTSTTEQNNKWRDKLLIEVKYLQQMNPPMSYVDKDWFDRPYNELEKLKAPSLLAWIRNARQLVKINRREFNNSIRVPMSGN